MSTKVSIAYLNITGPTTDGDYHGIHVYQECVDESGAVYVALESAGTVSECRMIFTIPYDKAIGFLAALGKWAKQQEAAKEKT